MQRRISNRRRTAVLAHSPKVHGREDVRAPSGEKISVCHGIAGTITINSISIEQ